MNKYQQHSAIRKAFFKANDKATELFRKGMDGRRSKESQKAFRAKAKGHRQISSIYVNEMTATSKEMLRD